MKIHFTLILLVLALGRRESFGQMSWFAADSVTQVRRGAQVLLNPWAGGLNAAQYSKMDLNEDGIEDLVVFDRTTSRLTTFLADPLKKQFVYKPEYEARFPTMTNWMLLADYDNDGKKELFTYISYGITAYEQVTDGKDGWYWSPIKEYLTVQGLSGSMVNLYVVASDIPALVDVDGDGDMDIVTFESGGDFLELNQNMSMERYGIPDSLEFVKNGQCWGNFRKHTCNDFQFGVACGVSQTGDNARVMHAGNAILLRDLNGDGIKDLLLGNVDCDNLSIVYNDAAGLESNFTSFSAQYPSREPAVLSVFPAAYLEDVDFDGIDDLLVSPNVYGNDNLMMDFVKSGWYYHNAGTQQLPDFQLRQKDFLQSDMVDVGENAAVSFFDVDGDGDLDLIVGNRGRSNGTAFRGSLWLYKNVGTVSEPVYELDTDDYLGLSDLLGHNDLQPQWSDFNGDGKVDLGLATVFNRTLHYHYFPNQAAAGSPLAIDATSSVEVILPSELSVSDRVFFIDQDKDGDLDLVVGGVLGNISYYQNTGTPARPVYELKDAALGGVGPAFSRRYMSLSVADLDLDGKLDVVTVDQNGGVSILYDGDWGKWVKKDTATVLNRLTGSSYSPFLGTRLHVTVADINGDRKPDLAVGTGAGGVHLYRNILPVEVTGREPEAQFLIYPNPASRTLFVQTSQNVSLEIYSLLGKKVVTGSALAGVGAEIDIRHLPTGLYLVRAEGAAGVQVRKLVVSNTPAIR